VNGQHQKQRQREETEAKLTLYGIAAVLVVPLFMITWPASLAFLLVFLVWFFTRNSRPPINRSIHEAALPVLIGTSVFWIASLGVALWPHVSDNAHESLFEIEQWLLEARRVVHDLSGPNLTTYLVILGSLLILLCFFPESRAIGRLIRTKKELARLHLCLLAVTSFTFFGGHEAERLARKDHESRLRRFEISLRAELEGAQKFLATKLASEAVSEELKTSIPEPTKSRLIYLITTVQRPAYIEVQEQPDFPSYTSPSDRLAWYAKHTFDSWESKRVPIQGSSIRKAFIDDLRKEVQAREKATQNTKAGGAEVESLARRYLGGVAESPKEFRRQEDLIRDGRIRAEQSEQLYREASIGATEAITTTFSEALGALTPHMNELAKEWIKELIDEAVIPSFEHNIEGHADAVFRWSRGNLAAAHVQDVPDQLKQETRPSPAMVSEFLFPSFITKGPGPSSLKSKRGGIPDEIAHEIFRREEIAEKEIGGGPSSRGDTPAADGGSINRESEFFTPKTNGEREERLPERPFRRAPRAP
jgi:hypothetical protein